MPGDIASARTGHRHPLWQRASPLCSRTRLSSLPQHLLRNIIQDDLISHDDVLALHLACVALNHAASAVLFHRIRISPLRRDRDNFLAICRSPHLAQHVREVEWQELSWFPGYFRYLYTNNDFYRVPQTEPERADRGLYNRYVIDDREDAIQLCDILDRTAADLFWLRVAPFDQDGTDLVAQHLEVVTQFQDEFRSALDRLPHLHTLISRPMSSDRNLDWGEYPINVKLLQSHHSFRPTKNCQGPDQRNGGLFHFLLPAIEGPALSITRLLWEDEFPGASYSRQPSPAAFQRLEALSVSLVHTYGLEYDHLAENLNAATNVRHLDLGLQGMKDERDNDPIQLTLLRFSMEEKCSAWSRLLSLSLDSMPLAGELLFSVVESNAESLRHLYLRNCSVSLYSLKKLAGIPNLLLRSLRVDQDKESRKCTVDENALLRFVNKLPPQRDDDDTLQSKSAEKRIVATVFSEDNAEESQDGKESICSDAGSDDSADHRIRTAPKWVWGRYFHKSIHGEVYCNQVPDSHPGGRRTRIWRFTSRDGIVGYGADPLWWFEEWDPEEGDVEEPTPYCEDLYVFYELHGMDRWDNGRLWDYLGEQSSAWELVRSLEPPEGAIKYDHQEGRDLAHDDFRHEEKNYFGGF
ncbi:hypothetical protein QQZ08_001377 [Neonectria magnoliae]|uniref:F-box domain-containing protein n=1 Tax=Neonectria magnoliae TaxID=2732573 RepID=A0ABR1IEM1_9HYPO